MYREQSIQGNYALIALALPCRKILESKDCCLNDHIIDAAQGLLKVKYGIHGLQNTLLGSTPSFDVVGGEEFVQVLHSGGDHWLTVSTIGCFYSTVNVYDSLFTHVPKPTMEQICALLISSEPTITLQFMPTDCQQNASDCGLFSLAFSTALCVGEDPQGLQFDQKVMRSHLLSCLVDGEMNPFPCKKMTRRCKTKKTCKIAIHCTC